MHRQIADYMKAHGLLIMALQETKNPTTTQYVSEGYLFLLYGNGENREHAGIGFVIDMRIRRAIRSTCLLYTSPSPRD
eukprot:3344074-Alexandrium_andersonii.AAC.1